MEQIVVELKQIGEMWQVTVDENVIVCAINRNGAIHSAGSLLRSQLMTPESVAQMTFVGLELEEIQPPQPGAQNAPPLPSKIDFEHAKQLVTNKWLPLDEKRVETAV